MAVQFRTLHRNPVLEKGYELQKVCLGGKINTPQDIERRMDTADMNMRNTCEYCKGGIKCLLSQCPVKYAHVKIVNLLLDMDEVFQKFETTMLDEEDKFKQSISELSEDEQNKAISNWWYHQYKRLDMFPYVDSMDARDDSLRELLALYQEAIDKSNNPGVMTGLDKIKTFFGGK